MVKELSELTLEELWILFPIILKDYNPAYPQWYQDQKDQLTNTLATGAIKRLSHIGSTAVKGLLSKPTIDILLEIDDDTDIDLLKRQLEEAGWLLMHHKKEPELNYVFNKGYTKYGFEEKVYHLHVRHLSDWNELYFRDYLIDHPDIAESYGALKASLLDAYENNRDGYTDAKTEFIKKHTEEARKNYKGRY